MKNLFKTLLVCLMLACVGNLTTSCMQDSTSDVNNQGKPGGGSNGDGEDEEVISGPPSFKIVGEAQVHTALSVDIPVEGENIVSFSCLVKEIYYNEAGEKSFVDGYDEKNDPILSDFGKIAARIVNRNGNKKNGGSSVTNIHLDGNDGLDINKKFVAFIVAIYYDASNNQAYYKDESGEDVFMVEFETPDRYADDDIAVMSQSYEGMKVHVTFPESVKAKNRVLKWGVTNIAMLEYNGNPSLPELLHSSDMVYPAYIIKRDTLLDINHYNAYRRNEKGEIGYYKVGNGYCTEVDPNSPEVISGEAGVIQYYYNFQPGEPLVLLLMEADYADCDCSDPACGKKHPTIDWGWGAGWYWYPYNLEAYKDAHYGGDLPNMGVGGSTSTVDPNQFWYEGAWYRQIELRLPGPKKFDGSVKVEFQNITTKDAEIILTPDEQTFGYFLAIYADTDEYGQGYSDMTSTYLDGDESLWQWFTTSEMGGYFGVQQVEASKGVQTIKLSEYFGTLQAGMTYHVLVNALGRVKGDDGDYVVDFSAQNFQHQTFTLKNYTKKAPNLIVTAAEPYDPWEVKFNLKNPDWQTNRIDKVSFAVNEARMFEAYMKTYGYSYTDMAMMNAGITALKDTDIDAINSPAGADIIFDFYEKTSVTAVFIAWNEEGRVSDPDSSEYPGYATTSTLAMQPVEHIPHLSKLTALAGDWTATATVNVWDPEAQVHTPVTKSWKVTIGDLTSPDALTPEQYAIFEKYGQNKEKADAYLAEFKELEAAYNASVYGQNRVLCTGWAVSEEGELYTATPWDLFVMDGYSATTTSNLFNDFGPKWFLQVNANGDVFIPVNYTRVAPLTSWYNRQNYYLCGANYNKKYAMLYDPSDTKSVESMGIEVEIKDENTFVLKEYQIAYYQTDENNKPIVDENGEVIVELVSFYPNVVYELAAGGIAHYNNYVSSDVTLTRGWNPTPTPTPSPSSASVRGSFNDKKVVPTNVKYTTPNTHYMQTALLPMGPKVETTYLDIKQPTPEEIRKGMEEYLKKLRPTSLR